MRRFQLSALLAMMITLPTVACGKKQSPEDLQDMARMLSHVQALASGIGPRPAGSPGDRAAQDYILKQMEAEGLQTQRDAFDHARSSSGTDVLLETANVVGWAPGSSRGAILVGSHHDSRNIGCPGASDDASGVAVMLETARSLLRQPHRKTLIFASFGGEETFGLPGSRHFLEGWKGEPIRLAITLDFVGSGKVFIAPFPVPPELWANRMLRQAEQAVRTERVSFDPWLVIVPRLIPVAFSADHVSFQVAGVPALNLSCQFPAWTYHTAEDTSARVEGKTLLAARDLVVRMVGEADRQDPETAASASRYLPFSLFGYPFFFTEAWLKILVGIVLLLAAATLVRFRRELLSLVAVFEAMRSVLVSIPLAALGVSGAFLAEAALRRLSGVRHPGVAHQGAHLAGALLATAFTLWLSFFLSRFLRPSNTPGAYLAPAVLLEAALAGGALTLGRIEVAFPFVLAAGAMIFSAWSRHAVRRLGFGLVGAAALIPFLSPTTYRMFLELSGVTLPGYSLKVAAGALALPWFLFFQHLACMPEALYARPGGILSRPFTGGGLALLALGAFWGNAMRPSYDSGHRALVAVREEVDLPMHRAVVSFSSLETLRSVRLAGLGERSLPDRLESEVRVPFPSFSLPGFQMEVEDQGQGEMRLRIVGLPPGSPRWIALRLQAGKDLEVERDGAWEAAAPFRLVLFPVQGQGLDRSVRLRRSGTEPLTLEADISYDSDLLDLRPAAPFRVFRIESRVHFLKRLL
jgi:hypothetical protein